MHPIIAIDGPAASGKSTVAKKLAQKLNWTYVDTGAMYRAFAWAGLQKKIDLSSRKHVIQLIEESGFQAEPLDGRIVLTICGINPDPYIRTEEVSHSVSIIAAVPELREYLVTRQRALRKKSSLVMEGRDIGTVVASDTPYKFFIDADPEIRQMRRQAEGQTDALKRRDAIDSGRAAAPTMMAADSLYIDSTHLSPDQIIDEILKDMKTKGFNLNSV